jgi:hypothetical protein
MALGGHAMVAGARQHIPGWSGFGDPPGRPYLLLEAISPIGLCPCALARRVTTLDQSSWGDGVRSFPVGVIVAAVSDSIVRSVTQETLRCRLSPVEPRWPRRRAGRSRRSCWRAAGAISRKQLRRNRDGSLQLNLGVRPQQSVAVVWASQIRLPGGEFPCP